MAALNILTRAAALGIRPPVFTEAARPGLWDRWQSRVILAECQLRRGASMETAIREATIFGGHPVEVSLGPRTGPMLDLDLFRQLRGSILAATQPIHPL